MSALSETTLFNAQIDSATFDESHSGGWNQTDPRPQNFQYNPDTGIYTLVNTVTLNNELSGVDQASDYSAVQLSLAYPGATDPNTHITAPPDPRVDALLNFTFILNNGLPDPNGTFTVKVIGFNQNEILVRQLLGYSSNNNGVTYSFSDSESQGYYILSDSQLGGPSLNNLPSDDNGTPVQFPITFDSNADNIQPGSILGCFLRGALIATPRGAVPVEDLRVGDAVELADGSLSAVRWLGRQLVSNDEQSRSLTPVRIEAGAFGPNQPSAPLHLSGDHAVFIDGALIPVRFLENGVSIRRAPEIRSIEYFHVELDEHAVMLANGLACESYLDTSNRGSILPQDRGATVVRAWEGQACAPFVASGPRLAVARARIDQLAEDMFGRSLIAA